MNAGRFTDLGQDVATVAGAPRVGILVLVDSELLEDPCDGVILLAAYALLLTEEKRTFRDDRG